MLMGMYEGMRSVQNNIRSVSSEFRHHANIHYIVLQN